MTTLVVERADQVRWLGSFDFRDQLPDGVDVVLIDADRTLEQAAARALTLRDQGAGGRPVFLAETLTARIRSVARASGVDALVGKRLTPDELAAALTAAAAGRRVDAPGRVGGPTAWLGQAEGLTQRESEVLLLCAEGLANREIADHLYLNIETVKSHLKHVYQRLGLRNRAQAAAYVHRFVPADATGPLDWTVGRPTTTTTAAAARQQAALVAELGLDDAAVAERRHLLDLSPRSEARLRPFAPAVMAAADSYVTGLIDRWLACDHTAPLLQDESTRSRLAEHHRRYLADVFEARRPPAHVEAMLRTGAHHHRLGLAPQWYLAATVHVISDHLPLLFDPPADVAAGTARASEAIEATCALISTVLFDASLVLDAYELSVRREVRQGVSAWPPTPTGPLPGAATAPDPNPAPDRAAEARAVTRIAVIADETEARRSFVGLDPDTIAQLHQLAPAITAATPAMLDAFYAVIAGVTSLAELVPPPVVERLLTSVGDYWQELAVSSFDHAHAESRVRIGLVHERIGITPQLYLTGLARQVNGLLRSLVPASGPPTTELLRQVDALIRAVFFDLTFVIDAYLDARIATLFDGERFARQIVAHLSTGVAVVDGRGRVEYVNEQLLAYVRAPARVLHRMPVDDALDLDGVTELVTAARTSATGRASTLANHRDRRLRVTAVCLHRAVTGDDGPVAVVVDDLTEVVRAGDDAGQDDHRLAHVLGASGALVWEADGDTLVLLAVSRGVEVLTGQRDVDLVGRTTWTGLFALDDQLAAAVRDLGSEERVLVDHRLRTSDGTKLVARSSLVADTDANGRRRVGAVTTPAPTGPGMG